MRPVLCVAALAGPALAGGLAAGPARAEGFTVVDLGPARDRESCMYRAGRMLERHEAKHGLHEWRASDWIVFAYDLRPGDQDVTVMCPILGGTGAIVNAFLNVHGETTAGEREATADALEGYWNE